MTATVPTAAQTAAVSIVGKTANALAALAALFNHPQFTGDITVVQNAVDAVIQHPDPMVAVAGIASILEGFGVKL